MKVNSSDQLVDTEGLPVQFQAPSPSAASPDGRTSGSKQLPSDKVTVTDFTRIALLVPPRDELRMDKLRLSVLSGEYGPPAATIAEALISRSLFPSFSI